MQDNNSNTHHSTLSDAASMVGGHAQYVKGAVEETIGNVLGSEEWKSSGARDKTEAVETMRASHHEPQVEGRSKNVLNAEGKAEETLGSALGCRGMQHDGEVKRQASL